MRKRITTELINTVAGLVARRSGARVQILARVALMLALLPSASYAVVQRTWTGSGSSNRWSNTNNWDTLTPWAAGDTVIFDGSTMLNLSNTLYTTSQTIDVLSFTVDQTNAVIINAASSGKLSLGNATASSATNLSVKAGNHKYVGANGGSGATADLQIYGPVAASRYFDVSGSASFEIAGRIKHTASSNGQNLFYKIGGGTLILSAHNGGTGGLVVGSFNVQEGVLRFANNNATGNSGNDFLVSSGAALEITNYVASASSTWTLNGTGIGNTGALRSIGGTSSLNSTGYVALASSSSIGVDSGTLTINRRITGASKALTKVGAGELVLATTNTFTGGMIVEAGTLSLGTNQALKASSPVTLSGGILAMNTTSNALSTLTLAGDATIDLGDGTGSLSFVNGSFETGKLLTLTGTLGERTLKFGSLTEAQKAQIKWKGYATTLNSEGYVTLFRGTIVMIF